MIEHTRDAMWQIDGLIHVLATVASLLSTQSKLAEDLEIWSSSEFDFVDLADGYTRASVLMPQKRNPYSLAIVRGASGVLIGRLTGFLAVAKSPSARSDNLIFAYGEVPRALDLALRVTALMTGVVARCGSTSAPVGGAGRGLHPGDRPRRVHQWRAASTTAARTRSSARRCGSQPTRDPGSGITGAMLDRALAETGRSWGLAEMDLAEVLDPRPSSSPGSAWAVPPRPVADGRAMPPRSPSSTTRPTPA